MHIENATNFEVDISINGMNGLVYVGMSRFLRLNIFRPRSLALICAINKHQPQTSHRHLVFGVRKHGDFMVYAAQNRFNASKSHLPRHRIEFQDNNVVLTSVLIRLNVSIFLILYFTWHVTRSVFMQCMYKLIYNSHVSSLSFYLNADSDCKFIFYFQTTTAIVFHNKVELSEHRFSVTIYGLVRDTISSAVIIYGYKP